MQARNFVLSGGAATITAPQGSNILRLVGTGAFNVTYADFAAGGRRVGAAAPAVAFGSNFIFDVLAPLGSAFSLDQTVAYVTGGGVQTVSCVPVAAANAPLVLQTNGSVNANQSKLNITGAGAATATDDGNGKVTIDVPAGEITGPDTPPAVPNAMDDEFTGTVLNVKWTKRNFANTAAAVPNTNPFDTTTGRLRFTCRNDGREWAIITQPISGVFSVAAKMWLQGSRNDFNTCGLVVMNTVSGKFANFGTFTEGASGGIEVQEWTDFNNFSADSYADHEGGISGPMYFKIESDGTTLTFSNSLDGILYSPVFTQAIATFLGSVNAIGLSTWGPTQPAPNGVITFDAIYQWFRRLV